MENIGDRLRHIRKKAGINQGEFAVRLGLKQGTYCDIENEKEILTPRNKRLVCLEFGVNENWLETGEGEPFKPAELTSEEKELLDIYEKLDPEIRKEIKTAAIEKLELQELRKHSKI
jgi:transcriptional regulator with XRE-family HTH domain